MVSCSYDYNHLENPSALTISFAAHSLKLFVPQNWCGFLFKCTNVNFKSFTGYHVEVLCDVLMRNIKNNHQTLLRYILINHTNLILMVF